jgi:hypothetical protein
MIENDLCNVTFATFRSAALKGAIDIYSSLELKAISFSDFFEMTK